VTVEFPHDNPALWELRAPLAALAILLAEAEVEAEAAAAAPPEPPLSEPAVSAEMDVDRSVPNDPPESAPLEAAEPMAEASGPSEPAVAAEIDVDRSVPNDPPVFSSVEAVDGGDDPEVEVIEFDEADFAAIENESIPPPAPPPDLFQIYVRTLVEVALAAGAPGRVVEALPGMLGLARLDARSLDDAMVDSLVGAGLLARSESGAVIRADGFVATAQAWRATLLGEEADFSVCSTMLDEWSANLIATLAGMPHQREALRRDLRSRGVAAFGLLVEAA
jgi:hypothetical protein